MALMCGVAIGLGWYFGMSAGGESKNTSPASYAPAGECQACHGEKHRDYQHVAMSQSFRTIDTSTAIEDFAAPAFVHSKSQRRYQMVRREGKLFQRRYELDGSGQTANAYELEITHVIGSGRHARSYLHRSASGELFQLPLTWYTQERAWNMSPGYDNATPPDFTRLVDDTCLFCHNGYPQNGVPAQGIDCQRCHGPGSEHVRLASAGNAAHDEIRRSIVNPKRLSADRQMDICMQCHLETTSAELPQMLRRFNRQPFSFKPGEPLGAYMVHFDHAPGKGHDDKFEIVNQAYRLRQSACFRESDGKMTCSSCHDPHSVPRGAAAVEHYRTKCMSCHPSVKQPSHPPLAGANCVSCHMPPRRAEDAVHVVMTDHFIQRKKPAKDMLQALAEHNDVYSGPLTIYYPPDLTKEDRDRYLGAALISGPGDDIQGVELLQRAADGAPAKALAILGEGYLQQGRTDSAIAAFQRAIAADPSLSNARYNLARALESAGQLDQARANFEQAIASQPQFPEAEYALGNLLARTGSRPDAMRHYANAIRMRPVYAEARSNLGNLHAAEGRLQEALSELEEAIRIHPAYAEAHNNAARVLALMNRLPDALLHARRAIALKNDYPEARYNLARLLQESGATEAALAEYKKLIAMRPSMVEAHLGLGQMLGDIGRLDAAISEFREVLRLQPGHAEAQRNLDMALSLKRSGG